MSRSPKKSARITLGLAISGALTLPGQRLTREQIAAFCDCSGQLIGEIEATALRKLRRKFSGIITADDIPTTL